MGQSGTKNPFYPVLFTGLNLQETQHLPSENWVKKGTTLGINGKNISPSYRDSLKNSSFLLPPCDMFTSHNTSGVLTTKNGKFQIIYFNFRETVYLTRTSWSWSRPLHYNLIHFVLKMFKLSNVFQSQCFLSIRMIPLSMYKIGHQWPLIYIYKFKIGSSVRVYLEEGRLFILVRFRRFLLVKNTCIWTVQTSHRKSTVYTNTDLWIFSRSFRFRLLHRSSCFVKETKPTEKKKEKTIVW